MIKASALIRERIDEIAPLLTREQGKPMAQAGQEVESAADIFNWFVEEGCRVYGRIIPSRVADVTLSVRREPVGPVAAFSPWNFPLAQAARKIGAALASGCSIILKGPEETPAALARLVAALHDAGIPAGVVNLVYGVPSQISTFLIPHPAIRKISFTGSTVVGKKLASMAGAHMKRATMELGGHSLTLGSRTLTSTLLEIADRLQIPQRRIGLYGVPETPFGGVKYSGYGSEGGSEAMEPYLISKFVTHSTVD